MKSLFLFRLNHHNSTKNTFSQTFPFSLTAFKFHNFFHIFQLSGHPVHTWQACNNLALLTLVYNSNERRRCHRQRIDSRNTDRPEDLHYEVWRHIRTVRVTNSAPVRFIRHVPVAHEEGDTTVHKAAITWLTSNTKYLLNYETRLYHLFAEYERKSRNIVKSLAMSTGQEAWTNGLAVGPELRATSPPAKHWEPPCS